MLSSNNQKNIPLTKLAFSKSHKTHSLAANHTYIDTKIKLEQLNKIAKQELKKKKLITRVAITIVISGLFILASSVIGINVALGVSAVLLITNRFNNNRTNQLESIIQSGPNKLKETKENKQKMSEEPNMKS